MAASGGNSSPTLPSFGGLGTVMCLQAIRVSMETDLSAETIARKAMAIAAGIRVYELQLNG